MLFDTKFDLARVSDAPGWPTKPYLNAVGQPTASDTGERTASRLTKRLADKRKRRLMMNAIQRRIQCAGAIMGDQPERQSMNVSPRHVTAFPAINRLSWRRLLAIACLFFAPTFACAAPAVTATQWQALEGSHWIADGRASAPRTIYMFTDPNCPYCNKLWTDARPWVESGKVQIRHLVVGILTPTSNGKAATLLDAKSPAMALADYEKGQSLSTARMIAGGKVRALDSDALETLASIPAKIQNTLDANKALMLTLGLTATPAVVWQDEQGGLRILQGIAPDDESRLFGPR